MEPTGISRRAFMRLGAGGVAAGTAAWWGVAAGADRGVARVARRRLRIEPPTIRELRREVRGRVLTATTPGFATADHIYNERYDGVVPAVIVRPRDAHDVRAAIAWAVEHGVPLRARSGGHSYAGYSTLAGGLVLDLRSLHSIDIDSGSGRARIGAGAQLLDVYIALAARGRTIPAGSCPSVGLGGHALGGGMGLAGRAFGLACDQIRGGRIVTADGSVRDLGHGRDRDLLWALRGGGGGNFGVVTAFELTTHRVPAKASWFFVSWPWSEAADALAAWQEWAPHTVQEISSVFHLQGAGGQTSVLAAGQFIGPASQLPALLAPLTRIGSAQVSSGEDSYLGLQVRWAGCLGQPVSSCHTVGTAPGGTLPRAHFAAKSQFVAHALSAAGRNALVTATEARARTPGSGAILLDAYGGAINRIAPHATAFVHRRELCCIQYLSYGGGLGWLRSVAGSMAPYVSSSAYQNYIDPELREWRHAYYGSNYERLVDVQRRYDPRHVFRFPQAIGV